MTQQIVPKNDKIARISEVMHKNIPNLKDLIPEAMRRHMTPERIVKIVLSAASRNPKLMECSPISILKACMTSTQLGLECDGILGGAYLVPYWNSQSRSLEAQFQIGYQGLMELARRSGELSRIEVEVVRKGDKFRCVKGIDTVLEHEPDWEAEVPGEFRAVYAIARFKDGGYQFIVLTKAEVDRYRGFSKGSDRGPWKDHYEAMAKKTAIRQLVKLLPKSIEMREAITQDIHAETIINGQNEAKTVQFHLGEIIDAEAKTLPDGSQECPTGDLESLFDTRSGRELVHDESPDSGSVQGGNVDVQNGDS
jgi:recombination protein RecT